MFSINVFLIFFALLKCVEAMCNYDCSCPDIEAYFSATPDAYTYEQGVGCAFEMKCSARDVLIESPTYSSNVPYTENGTLFAFLSDSSISHGNLPIISGEFFSAFGMVCENGKWWITKFPLGIEGVVWIPAEEANGKGYRMEVEWVVCFDNSP